MQMYLAGGSVGGHRVLSSAMVQLMRTDQIAGLPKVSTPEPPTVPGYSFGWWITSPSLHVGSPGPELSDQGAFGTTPWVDVGLNYTAKLLVVDRFQTGSDIWNARRPLVTEQISKLR